MKLPLAGASAGFLAPTKAPPSPTNWGEELGTLVVVERAVPGLHPWGAPGRENGSTACTGSAPPLLPSVSANSPNELTKIPSRLFPWWVWRQLCGQVALLGTQLRLASTGKATTSPR